MESANELYLKQAEHCRRMSDASKVEQTKVEWLLLAERWLRMIRQQGSNAVRFEGRQQA
jgi:hypothetical protein